MNLSMILIPVGVVYLATLFYVFKRFGFGLVKITVDDKKPVQPKLTSWLKALLNMFYLLFLFGSVCWPIFGLVMGLSQLNNPQWGIDMTVFGKFIVDVNQLAGVAVDGLRDPVYYGTSEIHIDTANRSAFWVFALIQQLMLLSSAYGTRQLQIIVTSLSVGDNFSLLNIRCIRNLGILVVSWNIVMPFANFLLGNIALTSVNFSTSGLSVAPALSLDLIPLFFGAILFLLAGVMEDAARLQHEQSLTI